ncbi:hypothetical protein JCM10212_002555 [Sporobolomyces blumeae]
MVALSRLQAYGLASSVMFVSTIVNAFRQRSNFYAAAVYLSKSNACMMILWNQGIFQTILFGKLLQAIFLGELRLIEVERLQERGWFAITETLLALTIFKDEFESTFVVLFLSLLFLKTFHWLASDRIEALEQSASVSRLAHVRMVGLLSLLWVADVAMCLFAADCILVEGPTVMIMFASEYMILTASVWAASMKYLITCVDMRRDEPWEEKSIYVFYVDLVADFFKLVTYLAFFGLTLTFYGLPLNILRDVYLTLRSFLLRIRDLRRYRQATRNMETLYPDATREEMEQMADKTCIICREDMEFQAGPDEGERDATGGEGEAAQPAPPARRTGPNETPKKLPCGHVFHFHCLKSWLERQQSCPTCRRPVLPQEQPANPAPAAGADALRNPPPVPPRGAPNPDRVRDHGAEARAVNQAHVNLARNLGRQAFELIFPNIPFPPEAAGPGDAAADAAPRPPRDEAGATDEPVATLSPPSPPIRERAPNAALPPLPEPAEISRPTATSSSTAVGPAPSPVAGPARTLLTPPHLPPSTSPPDSNPLARFNLPDLDLPPAGEAALYRAPPAFEYPNVESLARGGRASGGAGGPTGFADIAYGAYPHLRGRATRPPRPAGDLARGLRQMNLEEKIKEARERLARSAKRAGTTDGGFEGVPQTAASRRDTEKKDKGKGKEKAVVAELGEETPTPDANDEGPEVSTATGKQRPPLSTRESVQSLRRTDALAPWANQAYAVPLPPSRTPSPSPCTSRAEPAQGHPSPISTRPLDHPFATPRLIPLFDPASPSASLLNPVSVPLPRLAEATSSRSDRPSLDQLDQAERSARRAVEERLSQLLGFQDRIERLVDEMRTTLSADPPAAASSVEALLGPTKVEPRQAGHAAELEPREEVGLEKVPVDVAEDGADGL